MKVQSYKESLFEALSDPEESLGYLNAALEDPSPGVFLLALKDVSEALGVTNIARKADLNRENLYRMLSENGNPRFTSLKALLEALGLQLSVKMQRTRKLKGSNGANR